VHAVHLDAKGRGRALKHVWSHSRRTWSRTWTSTCPPASKASCPWSPLLLRPQRRGHRQPAAPAVGGRARPKREFISRSYNLLLKAGLAARFSDAQCGFKAVRTEVFRALAPHIEDNAWFFDTELLVLAQRNKLRIHEVPVDWVDDPDSRVDIVRTALDDLKGMRRMFAADLTGRARIAAVPARTRTTTPVLPVGAPASSAEHLEYAS
jgi:hypothetical protein